MDQPIEQSQATLSQLEIRLLDECTVQEDEISLLTTFPHSSQFLNDLKNGQYSAILGNEFYDATIETLVSSENDPDVIDGVIIQEAESHVKWLCAGIASLLHFVQSNFTGPFEETTRISSLKEKASKTLFANDEYNENTSNPELLYFSKLIFSSEKMRSFFPTCYWWSLRVNNLHQRILDEPSATIFAESETLIKTIGPLSCLTSVKLKAMFHLELAQFYLHHKRPQTSENYLKISENTLLLDVELKGALGKRTKFQLDEKAQLFVCTKLEKEAFPCKDCDNLPKDLLLNDEVRLERISFSKIEENAELGAVEESAILMRYFQLKISQPQDNLATEEIMPYLTMVLDSTKNWPLKVSSLYERCILESNHKRTIERSMMQLESLIDHTKQKLPAVSERIHLFFSSGMKSNWSLKNSLANIMLNLGMVKSALDLFLSLRLWEDVIVCYTILQLRHKATEIIEQELLKNPTVKLWCLLGDSTDKVEHYETAWKLSKEKSSRVQRHWGLHFFSKSKFAEAIPHLKLSVELNNIQETVWAKLGYAALQVEDWNLAASAYRKYCSLEQTNFEVWNNLAKAYVKLGDKQRAWHCLRDAIKYNYDRWEVWDNWMIVSIDTGHFSEVLRCYHRILDLKGQHVDVQVLEILKDAIVNEVVDAEGESARKLLDKTMQFFGRLTSMVPNKSEVWLFYGALAALKEKESAAQYLQKAHRIAVSDPRWSQMVDSTLKVLDLCCKLADAYLICIQGCSEQQKSVSMLGSAKLSLQSVIKKVQQEQWTDKAEVSGKLKIADEKLKVVLEELEKMKS